MDVASMCQRHVTTIRPSDELVTAAELMRTRHVGYLIVVEPSASDGRARPLGVLTDRDIVVSVVARHADPKSLRVGDVMTRDPVTARETDSMEAALSSMRRIGVRRVPVVDALGRLTGVLSLDDVIDAMAAQLGGVAASIRNEQRFEGIFRP